MRWTFGRELLSDGLYEPSGDGDVHVWPCLDSDGRAVVIIELCSPDGEALVQARTSDLSTLRRADEPARCSRAPSPRTSTSTATIAAIFAAEAA